MGDIYRTGKQYAEQAKNTKYNKLKYSDVDCQAYCELVLKDLGVKTINLMTNNPLKVYGLEDFGLKINKRVPIEISPQKFDAFYLKTKNFLYNRKSVVKISRKEKQDKII